MSSYATKDDYERLIGSAPEGIERRLEEASDLVDRLTYNRVRPGLSLLQPWQQELVKKAVCYQAECLQTYGAYALLPVSGFSAGSVSVQMSKGSEYGGELVDMRAVRCLKSSGLMHRRLS